MIHKGIVVSNDDPLLSGRLLVYLPGLFEKAIWCLYGSPVGTNPGGGGFVGIPEINTEVLVAAPKNDEGQFEEYVWFAAIYTVGNSKDSNDYIPKGGEIYKETGIPRKYILKSPGGHVFEMSDTKGEKMNESLVRTKTKGGKQVTLDDTFQNSRITIIDENENGLEISSKGKIMKISSNTLHLVAKDNDLLINIKDGGGNISIINNGSGDISIKSQAGDISLESSSGKVGIKGKEVDIEGSNVKITADRVDFL